MKTYNVINYHITNSCNFGCTYCFGKFDKQQDPSPSAAKEVVDSIAAYFEANGITDGRINLAGGEPTLYEHLDQLIDHISSRGILCSIVTNGSNLTPEYIRSLGGRVYSIGLSIDSLLDSTNLAIGRCCRGVVLPLSHYLKLSEAMHSSGIDLKINTVVSRLNINEDFSKLYRNARPKKIKLFQMHIVEGINDRAKKHIITKDEFEAFCNKHSEFSSVIVAEPCGTMENSYLMINPEGKFQLNDNGKYKTLGDLRTTSLSDILSSAPLSPEKFDLRYRKEGEI
ncbi:MAG: viperin family antiviral radical SAM protein [Clostridia bacterium]|nr:viperin family antiviral radical SAM protein [Clostridia bacterium]